MHSPVFEPQRQQETLHKLSFNDDRYASDNSTKSDEYQHQSLEEVGMRTLQVEGRRQQSQGLSQQCHPSTSSTTSTRRKLSPKSKLKRKKSPSPAPVSGSPINPSVEEEPSTWQDHEITGHLMQDADDDGYGINGIGFRPTAALAYARSQRRKQQIEDWRARESKDARQMRSERRRKIDGGSSGPPSFTGVSSNDGDNVEGEANSKRRSVRFA